MSAAENKGLMQNVCSELERGNPRPFVDCMAEDFTWHMIGTTKWSGTYRGKEVVRRELFAPLMASLEGRYTNAPVRILADGDHVVVECRGNATTKSGKPYNNTYCWVCRLEGGQLKELTEYMDTELVTEALGDPERPVG